METGRTFATIFADIDFRQKLLDVHGEAEFKGILLKHAQDLASEQSNPTRRMGNHEPEAEFEVNVWIYFFLLKIYCNLFSLFFVPKITI